MNVRNFRWAVTVAILFVASFAGSAAAQDADAPIFGRDLMTAEERAEHRERMRTATTDAERNAIRAEQHEQMKKRAEELGVSIPDEPPPRGRGMGQGRGAGRGPE